MAVREIIIPAGAGKTRGRPHRFKTTGAVTGAAVVRLLDKACHDQDRMAPTRLPVGAQAAQTHAQHARGQMGIALALRQDPKATVIDDQPKAAGARARTPADPALASFDLQGRRTQGD